MYEVKNGDEIKREAKYPEGFSEGSLSWRQLSLAITSSLADDWFGAYQAKKLQDVLAASEIDYDESSKLAFDNYFIVYHGDRVIPDFCSTLDKKDFKPVPFAGSSLAQSLIKNLKELGLFFEFEKKLHIDD